MFSPPVLAMDTKTNQTQTHSCWGHTIKSSITSLTTIPQCTKFSGCFLVQQRRPSIHHSSTVLHHCSTILPLHEHCSAAKSIVQVYVLFVIWIVSYEHWSSRKQKILCMHNTVKCYFWLPSALFVSQEAEQLDWKQAKSNSLLFLLRKRMTRQQCCFYINSASEKNR